MDGQLPTAFASNLDFFDSKTPIDWLTSPFSCFNPQIRWLKDNFFLLWYQLGYFLLTPNFCCWTPPKPWFVISGTFSRQNVWLSSWAWPLWCTRACHLWSSSAVVDGGWCWDSRLRFFCRFCCVVFSNLGRSWYVLYDYGFDGSIIFDDHNSCSAAQQETRRLSF